MICANIITSGADFDAFTSMEEWCVQNIGNVAGAKDQVDDTKPWYHEFKFGMYIWYFANSEDATLFKLKWP